MSESFPDLVPLANRISQLAASYDATSPNSPEALHQLRLAVRELEARCTPAVDIEYDFHYRPHANACVRIAVELRLFDQLGESEAATPATLAAWVAASTGAEPEFTLRIIRGLCASGVLAEVEEEQAVLVSHTALSRLWHRRPTKQAYVRHQWDNMVRGLSVIIPYQHTHGFKSPDDPTNTPLAYALGAKDVGFFELLERDADRFTAFNQAMSGMTVPVAPIFPFGSLAAVTGAHVCLVDVAGGRGHNTKEILAAFPELKDVDVVLQDLAHVLQNEQGLEVDPGRIKVQAYNFLQEEQPVRGAAAYLFKYIFHDWPDKACRRILQNLVPAMRGFDSRLLICDLVLGRVATSKPHKALRDINIVSMAGRERSVDEWKALLETEGFRIIHIWGVDNPGNSIIEARLEC
ncbi:O-methyltransferase-domain-containing protein [Xylariaceae sp. FL0594]|nr:O-methyltransferase-domain-containing protein [Xylariaceae sp. FL0594]